MTTIPVSISDNQVIDPDEALLTFITAASELHVPLDRLRGWRKAGHLSPVARIRGDQSGGGVFLFRRQDIERLIQNPPRRGRPPGRKPKHDGNDVSVKCPTS